MFGYSLKSVLFLILFYGVSLAQDFNTYTEYKSFSQKLNESLVMQGISLDCKLQIEEYVKGLRLKEVWALKMFDAAAKPQSGIFEGNLVDLGTFDECLQIEQNIPNNAILGKYCLPTISLSLGSKQQFSHSNLNFVLFDGSKPVLLENVEGKKINLRMATCLPNACSVDDIQKIYNRFSLSITIEESTCQTKDSQPKLDTGGILTLSFLAAVLCIIIISTIYDAIVNYFNKVPIHPILIAFSILTNGRKILTTSNNPNEISCLHGIRVVSTMWVILGHRYLIQSTYPIKYYLDMAEWMSNQENMFILGATVSVDTFFLMAGMVISYLYMTTKKEFNILLYYIHRYLRLTPALAMVILIHVTLLEYIGSGPLWPSIKPALIDNCEKSWWKELLYIQNYGNIGLCIPQGWYLAVDMQLFILSPILLLPMKRWPKLTLLATGLLTFLSILSCFLTAWFYELNGSLIANTGPGDMFNYMKKYYMPMWTRAAPWLIGIMLGYIIFKAKQKRPFIMNKVFMVCTWTISLAILCTCIFAGHGLSYKEYNKLENSIYIAFVRPVWSLALAWVIFACVTAYGGPINWFLSLPVFQVVSKFTYSLYLVHYTLIHITTLQMRTPPILSNEREMYIFWGDFAFCLVIAVILTLAFESPIITIEKCIFGKMKAKHTKEECNIIHNKPKQVEIA